MVIDASELPLSPERFHHIVENLYLWPTGRTDGRTHSGVITLGDSSITVYLDDEGKRVFDLDEAIKFFDGTRVKGDDQ